MRKVKSALFLAVAAIFTIGLLTAMMGCAGEEEGEAAKIVSTNPSDGGEMFANGELKITFDKAVTEVKVNGTPAEVAGTVATWKGQGLSPGQQTLTIEWTDEAGNTGSGQITLTIKEADTTPPEVAEANVKDGATNVDPGELNEKGIIIKFSEPIDTKKSKDPFTLSDETGTALAWAAEWNDAKDQATLSPTSGAELGYETKYTLTIKKYFDAAGNEGAEVKITFTTKAKEQ
jgi:hypothetical protein